MRDILQDSQKRRLIWTPVLGILSLLSLVYRLACGVRLFLYQHGMLRRKKLKAKVISVGNITVGGTGKTPLVIYLAKKLKKRNKKVAVLSRGYRRKKKEMILLSDETCKRTDWEDVGDEPYLLVQRLSDVPIIVTKHRNLSGNYAIKKHNTEFLILDDGFQHLKLFRDLDIVVIDSVRPFGNRRLLPSGSLREPLTSLKRADFFVLTKTDQVSNTDRLIQLLRGYNTKAPIVESVYQVSSIERLSDGSSISPREVDNKKALAFSGIGNPLSFEKTLEKLRIQILKHRKFSDHFSYRKRDIIELDQEGRSLSVDFIITTEKDSVRIPLIKESKIPLFVLKIDLHITRGEKNLWDKIEGKD